MKTLLIFIGSVICLFIGWLMFLVGPEGRNEGYQMLFPDSPISRIERIKNINNSDILKKMSGIEYDKYNSYVGKYNRMDQINPKWGLLPEYCRTTFMYKENKGTLVEQQKHIINIILRTEKIKQWCRNN